MNWKIPNSIIFDVILEITNSISIYLRLMIISKLNFLLIELNNNKFTKFHEIELAISRLNHF